MKIKATLVAMTMIRFLRAEWSVKSKLITVEFKWANFGFFKDLLGRVLWDKALEGRGTQENQSLFKDHLIQA